MAPGHIGNNPSLTIDDEMGERMIERAEMNLRQYKAKIIGASLIPSLLRTNHQN
jgi:hypothetical protein